MGLRLKKKIDCPTIHACDGIYLSEYAYEKLAYIHDNFQHEVGGFGVAIDPKDPFYVNDICISGQDVGPVSVEWTDEDIAEYHDKMIGQELQPYQFMRIWCHTHPEFAPTPSQIDEKTFGSTFANNNWSVMLIIGKAREIYCRFKNNELGEDGYEVPVYVDYDNIQEDIIDRDTYKYWNQQVKEMVRVNNSRPMQYFYSPIQEYNNSQHTQPLKKKPLISRQELLSLLENIQ